MSLAPLLRPGVHAATIDDDLALLDVAADAYVCLPQAAAAWRCGVRTPGGAALAEALCAAGLTRPDPGPCPPAPPALPTRRIEPVEAPMTRRDLAAMAGALLDLACGYRGRPFRECLAFVRRAPQAPRAADAELIRLCAVFERAVVWLPVSGKCLVRSFLLLRFLQRSGRDAAWVLGVRLWPFAAHCWLQVDELVLDDWPERLAPYTPIHVA